MKIFFVLFSLLLNLSCFAQQQDSLNQKENLEKTQKEKQTQTAAKQSSRASQILGMSVTGNKESPRSLTIVPWRSPLMDGEAAKINPVWQPNLGLLEPDSYRRNINLFLKQRDKRGL